MAFNVETPTWVEGIYQLEEADSPIGGLAGTTNKQFTELACRTNYLHLLLKNLYAASVSGRTITSWTLGSTVKADTEVLLPVKYLVGAHALILFSDASGEISPKYYREKGTAGLLSDKVSFTFDIPAGTIMTIVTLATNVANIEYDTSYEYKEAYTEKYLLRTSLKEAYSWDMRFKTFDQHSIALDDSILDVGPFVEDSDTFEVTKLNTVLGSFKTSAFFNEKADIYDEFSLYVARYGELVYEDVSLLDILTVRSHYFKEQVDAFLYDQLDDADDVLALDIKKGDLTWIDDADFTDTYSFAVNDDALLVAAMRDGSAWEGVYITDDYDFYTSERIFGVQFKHTPLSDTIDSDDIFVCNVDIVDKDAMPDNNNTLNCSAVLAATDVFNAIADDWEITVSEAKND